MSLAEGHFARMSVRIDDKGYRNMIGTEFEGCGVQPGLVFLNLKRGNLTTVETVRQGVDEDDIFDGKFHEKDCYFFLLTEEKNFGDVKALTNQSIKGGSPFSWKIYVWKGKKASLIQFGFAGTKASDLQMKLVENGNYHDCTIHKEHQGKESEEFKALFNEKIAVLPGNRIKADVATEGEVVSKVPKLFEVEQDRLRRIPIRSDYLRDDRNYILDIGTEVFSFSGKNCKRIEKAYTEEMARRRCKADYRKKVKAIPVAEADKKTYKRFLKNLKDHEQEEWAKWEERFDPELMRVDSKSGTLQKLEKQANEDGNGRQLLFDAELLKPGTMFVLDCFAEMYLWVGKGTAASDITEITRVLTEMLSAEERPKFVEIEVQKQNMETVYFKERFFGFDQSDLLEIGGSVRNIKSEKEFMIYTKDDEPKLRRVSGELKRVVQFLEEREEDFDKAQELHLAKDESSSLIGFKYDQKGNLAKMEEWEFGFFETTKMYTYIFSCKNDTMHYIFTWEGEHASTRAKTVAGISTTGKDIPGLTEEIMGTKVFKFITQGREPRLLTLLLENMGKNVMIKQGIPTEKQRNQAKVQEVFLDKKSRKLYAFEVNEIGNFGARTIEIPYKTLLENGFNKKTCYVVFRGPAKQQKLLSQHEIETAEVFYWLGAQAPESCKKLAIKIAEDPVLPRSLKFQDFAANSTNCTDLALEKSKHFWGKDELNLFINEEGLLPGNIRPTRLFRISQSLKNVGGMFIHDIGDGCFAQQDLHQKEVFLLDTGSSKLFLWIGSGCANDQIKLGLETATRYLERMLPEMKKFKDAEEIEVTLDLLDSGNEPMPFKSCFYGWKNFGKSKKNFAQKFGAKLEEFTKLAQMDDNARKFQEETKKHAILSQRLEQFKTQNTLRKSRMKTLQKGRLVNFKKTLNEVSVLDKVGDRIEVDPETNLITVTKIGKPLKISQGKFSIDEVCSSIHLGDYTWALFGYQGESDLEFMFRGQKDTDQLMTALGDYDTGHDVFYAILKIPANDLDTNLSKGDRNLFITFIPETTPPMLRAACNAHRRFLAELFGPFFSELTLRSVDELNHKKAIEIASK